MRIFGINSKALSLHLPHLGLRIIKTGIAVAITLVIKYLLGFHTDNMAAEAAITAIICMQPHVHNAKTYAINRFTGSLIGAFWGMVFLAIMYAIMPPLVVAYVAMGAFIIVTLYTTVLVKKADCASLAGIVFLCLVISFPEAESTVQTVLLKLGDIVLGTLVAVLVNAFRLPRQKNNSLVFFVRVRDIAPGTYSVVSPSVHFQLSSLYGDGAKICLISDHAPAFFVQQLGNIKLTVPMIVMDGAAIYDTEEMHYIWKATIRPELVDSLTELFTKLEISYSVYTIHEDRIHIYHRGEVNEAEKKNYNFLKKSPFRNYSLAGNYDKNEVICFKISENKKELVETILKLDPHLPKEGIRTFKRTDTGIKDVNALYIFSETSYQEQAQQKVMQILKERQADLNRVDVFLPSDDRFKREDDALNILNIVRRNFERIKF